MLFIIPAESFFFFFFFFTSDSVNSVFSSKIFTFVRNTFKECSQEVGDHVYGDSIS